MFNEYIGTTAYEMLHGDKPDALKKVARMILVQRGHDGDGGRGFRLESVMETGTQFWTRRGTRYKDATIISNGESYFYTRG